MFIATDFLYSSGLKGSARAVSLVRILLGGIILNRFFIVFPPYFYTDSLFNAVVMASIMIPVVMMILGLFSRCTTFLCGVILITIYFGKALGIEPYLGRTVFNLGSYAGPTHFYYIAIVSILLSMTPCGNFFSLDSIFSVKLNKGPVNLRAVQLIRLQLCAVYFWTAISKVNQAVFSGVVLEQSWIVGVRGSLGYFHNDEVTNVLGVISPFWVALEFALAIFFCFPNLRKYGLGLGVLFHFLAAMVLPVGPFSLAIMVTYLLFLEPDQFDRYWLRLAAG